MKKIFFFLGIFVFFLGASMGDSEDLWIPIITMIAGGTIVFRSKYFQELRKENEDDAEGNC